MHPSLFIGHTVEEKKLHSTNLIWSLFFVNLVLFVVVFLAQKWRMAISVDGEFPKSGLMGEFRYFQKASIICSPIS